MNDIQVSVICNTYNHEKYIRKCLDSFVMQQTSFDFEVLVHDDASTDSTADIIREYEKKYPSLIKPIYQVENQRSKHNGSIKRFQRARVKGKYVALCEGDDYWTDSHKLQTQYDILEKHPEIDMCSHAVDVLRDNVKIGVICPLDYMGVIPVEKVIMGGGEFLGTNSLFMRKSMYMEDYPFRKVYALDYSQQIQGALRGGVFFDPKVMSVYNFMNAGSWTARNANDETRSRKHYSKMIEMLDALDEETCNKYHQVIEQRKLLYEYIVLKNYGPFKSLLEKKYRPFFRKEKMVSKIKLLIKIKFPFLMEMYRAKKLNNFL